MNMKFVKFEKEYSASESAPVLNQFISLYVDTDKIPERVLLWNSIKDEIKFKCLPFSEIAALDFFRDKLLFLYDERERRLYQVKWNEVVDFIDSLEPWEENIDFLVFDESFEWFVAVTHEDLMAACVGTILQQLAGYR